MKITNFDDFSKTITKDVVKGIIEEINSMGIVVKGNDINETINSIIEASTTSSTITTLNLLRRYHEWLSAQFEK